MIPEGPFNDLPPIDVDGLRKQVQQLVAEGKAGHAVRLLVDEGYHVDAGRLILRVLRVEPSEVYSLTGKQRDYALRAATYFAQGGDDATTAVLLNALGEQGSRSTLPTPDAPPMRRKQQHTSTQLMVARRLQDTGSLVEALAVVMRVARDDPSYGAACICAIDIASTLNVLDFELDGFVAQFIARDPANEQELRAQYVLARLYESNDYLESALSTYRRIHGVARSYRDVDDRMKKLDDAPDSADRSRESLDSVSLPSLDVGKQRVGKRTLIAGGTVIAERYHVAGAIGRGGVATVYEVEDVTCGEKRALKYFDLSVDHQIAYERFRQELVLMRELDHPNIVRVYDSGEEDGRLFMTMELLVGRPLSDVIRHGRPSMEQALHILVQACHGLEAAHQRGIIHRDVKPENLFLTDENAVKVMDFGLAKRIGESRRLTLRGTTGGTPAYIAPEQVKDLSSVTERADIYSLGVVAYELFTGTLPFYHSDPMSCMFMHRTDPVPPPSERLADIPRSIERLLLFLLEKNPDDRVQSCGELAFRWMDIAASL